MSAWGVLTRVGGTEENVSVPTRVDLFHDKCFFGRFPEPVKNTENHFVHDSQVLIPCVYVSATHFSIHIDRRNPTTINYVIRDFSRNGTYINDSLEPVGRKDQPLRPNDTISMIYKNNVCITYLFTVNPTQTSVVGLTTPFNRSSKPTHPNSVHMNSNVKSIHDHPSDYDDSSRYASMKSQSEHITEGLNRQIQSLENELRVMDERLQAQSNKILVQTSAIDKHESKTKANEKMIETLSAELMEWKERSAASEANCSAVEARCCILTDTIEQNKTDIRELRHKVTALNEELASKNEQLDTRRAFVEDNNKMLLAEKDQRKRVQAQLQTLQKQNDSLQVSIHRMTMANQALQSVVTDKELIINKLKENYFYLEDKFQQLYKTTMQRKDNYNKLFHDFEALVRGASGGVFLDGTEDDKDVLLTIQGHKESSCLDDDHIDSDPAETQIEATYCADTFMQVMDHGSGSPNCRGNDEHEPCDSTSVASKRKYGLDGSSEDTTTHLMEEMGCHSPKKYRVDSMSKSGLEDEIAQNVRSDNLPLLIQPSVSDAVESFEPCIVDPFVYNNDHKHQDVSSVDQEVDVEVEQEVLTSPQKVAVITEFSITDIHEEESNDDPIKSDSMIDADMQSTQLPVNYQFLFEDDDDDEEGNENSHDKEENDDDDDSSLQSIVSSTDMIENVAPSNVGSFTKSQDLAISKTGSSLETSEKFGE